jgi:arabinose-5-phosphate isomerase
MTLHPGEALHGDLGRLRPEDLLLCLSNSGETAELRALVPAARRVGVKVLAMTERRTSTLGRLADQVLELGPVGEACPLGLAPTASTSAMLALGDALAMVVLAERGFSREDYARYHPGGSLGRKLARVSEFMRTGEQLPIASESATFGEVLTVAHRTPGRPGAVLLLSKEGLLTGIFTDGDMRRLLLAVDRPRDVPIAEHMGRSPKTIRPEQLVEEALHVLHRHKIDQLAVVDGEGRPVGLLDVQDVLDLQL